MKTLLALFFSLFLSLTALAQNQPNDQKTYKYCLLTYSNAKREVFVDFGDGDKKWEDYYKGQDKRTTSFLPMLNVLAAEGWELVEAYDTRRQIEGVSVSVHQMILKKPR